MATFERHVDVEWKGSVMEGKGEAKAGTGAFTLPVTFPGAHRRAGRQDEPRGADGGGARGVLRDGAQRHARPQEGASADRTVVRATVTADKGDAGIKIVSSSKLEVTAYGLKGLDAAQFAEIAKEAEGRCPVSNAYRGTMQITVDAKVGVYVQRRVDLGVSHELRDDLGRHALVVRPGRVRPPEREPRRAL